MSWLSEHDSKMRQEQLNDIVFSQPCSIDHNIRMGLRKLITPNDVTHTAVISKLFLIKTGIMPYKQCVFAFLTSSLNCAHSTMTQRSPLMFAQHVLRGITRVKSQGGRKLKGEKMSGNPKFMETLTIFRFLTNVGGGNPSAAPPPPPVIPLHVQKHVGNNV